MAATELVGRPAANAGGLDVEVVCGCTNDRTAHTGRRSPRLSPQPVRRVREKFVIQWRSLVVSLQRPTAYTELRRRFRRSPHAADNAETVLLRRAASVFRCIGGVAADDEVVQVAHFVLRGV